MGIELYWDNDDQTVMLIEVRGNFTWDEMYDMLRKVKKVTDRSAYEIAAILDLSEGVRFPGGSVFNPAGLQHAKNMLSMGRGGTGHVILVGVDGLIRKVYDVLYRMDKRTVGGVEFAETLYAAQRKLEGYGFNYPQPAAVE